MHDDTVLQNPLALFRVCRSRQYPRGRIQPRSKGIVFSPLLDEPNERQTVLLPILLFRHHLTDCLLRRAVYETHPWRFKAIEYLQQLLSTLIARQFHIEAFPPQEFHSAPKLGDQVEDACK